MHEAGRKKKFRPIILKKWYLPSLGWDISPDCIAPYVHLIYET